MKALIFSICGLLTNKVKMCFMYPRKYKQLAIDVKGTIVYIFEDCVP